MNPDLIAQCRRWFLSEIAAGAPPDMAAAFSGIGDLQTVHQWRSENLEFAAACSRALVEGSQRGAARGRPPEPCDLIGWLEARGGKARIALRALGAELGCSAAKVHGRVRSLASIGALKVTPGSRSTFLELF
jgi:hypothetical protein